MFFFQREDWRDILSVSPDLSDNGLNIDIDSKSQKEPRLSHNIYNNLLDQYKNCISIKDGNFETLVSNMYITCDGEYKVLLLYALN